MWDKIKSSWVANALTVALAIWLGYGSYKMIARAVALMRESGEEKIKIEKLKQKKAEIEASLRDFESNEAVEREAKGRLNLKIPGEEVVVVVPKKKVNSENYPAGFAERVKTYVKKLFSL